MGDNQIDPRVVAEAQARIDAILGPLAHPVGWISDKVQLVHRLVEAEQQTEYVRRTVQNLAYMGVVTQADLNAYGVLRENLYRTHKRLYSNMSFEALPAGLAERLRPQRAPEIDLRTAGSGLVQPGTTTGSGSVLQLDGLRMKRTSRRASLAGPEVAAVPSVVVAAGSSPWMLVGVVVGLVAIAVIIVAVAWNADILRDFVVSWRQASAMNDYIERRWQIVQQCLSQGGNAAACSDEADTAVGSPPSLRSLPSTFWWWALGLGAATIVGLGLYWYVFKWRQAPNLRPRLSGARTPRRLTMDAFLARQAVDDEGGYNMEVER